jgi:hypothetical protein
MNDAQLAALPMNRARLDSLHARLSVDPGAKSDTYPDIPNMPAGFSARQRAHRLFDYLSFKSRNTRLSWRKCAELLGIEDAETDSETAAAVWKAIATWVHADLLRIIPSEVAGCLATVELGQGKAMYVNAILTNPWTPALKASEDPAPAASKPRTPAKRGAAKRAKPDMMIPKAKRGAQAKAPTEVPAIPVFTSAPPREVVPGRTYTSRTVVLKNEAGLTASVPPAQADVRIATFGEAPAAGEPVTVSFNPAPEGAELSPNTIPVADLHKLSASAMISATGFAPVSQEKLSIGVFTDGSACLRNVRINGAGDVDLSADQVRELVTLHARMMGGGSA